MPSSASTQSPPQPRRTTLQRLAARLTIRPKQQPAPPPSPPPPYTPGLYIPGLAPTSPERAETLARLKQELVMLNEKERARHAEARADRIRVREAVEQFRQVVAEGGRESITGIGGIGELVE